jgi:hypothetical protein
MSWARRMKTGSSRAARCKELPPQRSASNTSTLVEIVMSKTLCRTPAPTAGAPGLGSITSFSIDVPARNTCDHVFGGAPIMPVSGERRQNAAVHPVPDNASCSEVLARAKAQPTHPTLASQSRKGVLTARQHWYWLRTRHRLPTSFAEPAPRSASATVHERRALLD